MEFHRDNSIKSRMERSLDEATWEMEFQRDNSIKSRMEKLVDSILGLSGPLGNPTTSMATRKIVATMMAGNQNYPDVGTGLYFGASSMQ
ncbi:hypothetical protein C5167_008750 [Papaver somniferum]|uniref:Uncharacterized protein n=1 Tax=Papaver somniferum TaxID=3469 RepID=A0A4Y7JWI8_PAPSO|nr:hypothetical protein C5167_008750 [Papaver somniferum]